jgi:hypothetical protein
VLWWLFSYCCVFRLFAFLTFPVSVRELCSHWPLRRATGNLALRETICVFLLAKRAGDPLNSVAGRGRRSSVSRKIPVKCRRVMFRMKAPHAANDSGSSLWPVTDWVGVGRAAGVVGKDAESLGHLILRYQKPLRTYLLSAFPSLGTLADELLQDFAQDRILREGWVGKANRDRGRFRDFLKTSLRNFVQDYLRKQRRSPASLDGMELDLATDERSAELFDLGWVRTILAEVLTQMEADCKTPGRDQPRRAHIWEVFRLRLLQPALEGVDPVGYEHLVKQFGIVSPADAQNMLATAKRIFTRHLHAVVADYEKEGAAVRVEIEELKQFLSRLAQRRNS